MMYSRQVNLNFLTVTLEVEIQIDLPTVMNLERSLGAL